MTPPRISELRKASKNSGLVNIHSGGSQWESYCIREAISEDLQDTAWAQLLSQLGPEHRTAAFLVHGAIGVYEAESVPVSSLYNFPFSFSLFLFSLLYIYIYIYM